MSGIFGAYNQKGGKVLEDVYLGLYALQHRGQLSAGVSWISDGTVHIKKGIGLVHDALNQNELSQIDANYAIGHVRHDTAGNPSNRNSQPLGANYSRGPIALAHSGNLTNYIGLASYLQNRGAVFHTETDSETILQLMAHQPAKDQLDALETALSKLRGAYSISMIISDKLIAARDPWGFRPLVLGKRNDTYYVASETCAFDLLGAELIRDIEPGEILIIDKNGISSRRISVEPVRKRHCAFEYVYFARPDSRIDGVTVYNARKKMGALLCKGCKVSPNALVTGMPDSGTIAALGLAEEAKVPYEVAIVRNRYVGRTFIQPTQRVREAGVKIKFNPQPKMFEEREVFVVDDSMVRGTTTQKVVSDLRDKGADRINIKIASPKITHPCYYGINTPSSDELAAARMNEDEICSYVGADSISFLSCEELAEAIGIPESELCTACFSGKYLDDEEFDNRKDF